jgi:hypothetical protein
MDRAELAESTREHIAEYIRFGDSKAGAVLVITLTVSGLLARGADTIVSVMNGAPRSVDVLIAITTLLLVVAPVMGVWHCIAALRPGKISVHKSAISYPEISADPSSYLSTMRGLDEKGIAEELEKHSADLAAIASEKFARIDTATWWLRVQVISSLVLVLLYVLARASGAGSSG